MGNYATLSEVRAEGVPTTITDQQITDAIAAAERKIEEQTSRWFYRRTGITLTYDGGKHYGVFAGFGHTTDLLQITVPIISLTGVNIDSVARDISDFIVYSRIGPPEDDRWNPRIIVKKYGIPCYGLQNIQLIGDFGFVEDAVQFTVPTRIKMATRKLAIMYLPLDQMVSDDFDLGFTASRIIEEEIPGYRYQLSPDKVNAIEDITGDPFVDSVIEEYKYKKYFAVVDDTYHGTGIY